MRDKPLSVLIAGQGLGGSILALHLLEAGASVRVADAGLPHTASAVAAGVYNPVTGRRLQRTWQAAALWDYLENWYPAAEKLLGSRFFFPLPNVRPVSALEQMAQLRREVRSGQLSPWVRLEEGGLTGDSQRLAPHLASLWAERAGYVDVPAFVSAVRAHLVAKGLWVEALVEMGDLILDGQTISWHGAEYDYVVLCQGAAQPAGAAAGVEAILPLAPLKGEILLLRPDGQEPLLPYVLNKGVYLAPRPDGLLWAGSTYEHRYTDPEPSQVGREDIERRVQEIYLGPYQVEGHKAGIRPSVPDRRPIVGLLHGLGGQPSRVAVLNGLGTKGVSLAPLMAKQLTELLLRGTPVDPTVAPTPERLARLRLARAELNGGQAEL